MYCQNNKTPGREYKQRAFATIVSKLPLQIQHEEGLLRGNLSGHNVHLLCKILVDRSKMIVTTVLKNYNVTPYNRRLYQLLIVDVRDCTSSGW
jgi:hypothetical protein